MLDLQRLEEIEQLHNDGQQIRQLKVLSNQIDKAMVNFICKHEKDEGWSFQEVVWLRQFAEELKKEIGGR